MKLLNLIESLLNCLYLAAELWDWLFVGFKALARILV
jgi:hypothetical protein